MKTVNIYKGNPSGDITVPKKAVVYDDENRKVKEIDNFFESNTKLVRHYEYDEDGDLIKETSENYAEGSLINSIEESYFSKTQFVSKRITKHFANDKLEYESEDNYSIKRVELTEEMVKDTLSSLLSNDDNEAYANMVTAFKDHILDIGVDEYFILEYININDEDDTSDVGNFLVFKRTGETVINWCDSFVEVFANGLDDVDGFMTRDIEYYRYRSDKKRDAFYIREIYDGFYSRKKIYDTETMHIVRVETTYYFDPEHPFIFTNMDSTGRILERHYYCYDGSTLTKIIDDHGNPIEIYHTEEDSQVLSEYPVVNEKVVKYDYYKS